ncbi:hypothetical protein COB55_00315 [Candidatus Wolfebacteria bacterium]|nr:MAG: hypothetical protein COB55_00315 [Candidatus Wolfebacteria bacterium]
MNIPYTYSYLILDILLLVVWVSLYLKRKDIRSEMLFISILFGISGPIFEPFTLHDWWRPFTVTGTPVGFEDFLFGFAIGGIASVIYEIVAGKKLRKDTPKKMFSELRRFRVWILPILITTILLIGIFILDINSWISSTVSIAAPLLVILSLRRDLITNALASGLLLIAIVSVVSTLVEVITPGWIQTLWIQDSSIPVTPFLNVPISDIVWYFFIGAYIGPLYEYWQDRKLKKI